MISYRDVKEKYTSPTYKDVLWEKFPASVSRETDVTSILVVIREENNILLIYFDFKAPWKEFQ